MPLSFEPGEAYQFDWSHEVVVLADVTPTGSSPYDNIGRYFYIGATAKF